MPAAYKVLGQSNPSATTLTTLYTVPASTSTILSTLAIANLSTSAITFRVAIRPAGATVANQHNIQYYAIFASNDSVFLTLGVSLAATDAVSVYASTANVAFAVFGTEIT